MRVSNVQSTQRVAADEVSSRVQNAMLTLVPHCRTVSASDTQTQRGFSNYFGYKRAFDLTLAMLLLVVILPVMVAVAIAVKLDSPGPVLFAQKRISVRRRIIGGKPVWAPYEFTFYKFRSMFHQSDSSLHKVFMEALINDDEQRIMELQGASVSQQSKYKLSSDPRITRVGRIIRATSLDELPQLINVIRGDMSLVGPRPAIGYEVDMYSARHLERLAAQPGITGLWQVRARSSVSFNTMVELDIEYTKRQSMRLDLEILVATIHAVLKRDGAR